MMKRRSFLGALLATPVAANAAAKSAIEKTGYSVIAPGPIGSMGGIAESTAANPSVLSVIKRLVWKYSKDNRLPDWKELQIRKRAYEEFRGLDADLATMRSMSLSHKIKTQRERNVVALRGNALRELTAQEDRANWSRDLHEKSGIYLDWY